MKHLPQEDFNESGFCIICSSAVTSELEHPVGSDETQTILGAEIKADMEDNDRQYYTQSHYPDAEYESIYDY